MADQQPTAPGQAFKLVDWSHVTPKDAEALKDVLFEMVKAHPELYAFCLSIGSDLVAEAFERVLAYHFPNHRTLTIPDNVTTVSVTGPGVTPSQPAGAASTALPTSKPTEATASTTQARAVSNPTPRIPSGTFKNPFRAQGQSSKG